MNVKTIMSNIEFKGSSYWKYVGHLYAEMFVMLVLYVLQVITEMSPR